MSITASTDISRSSDGVIRTTLMNGTEQLGTITTTVVRDPSQTTQHALRMTTVFGFYGYDGTDTFSDDKTALLALAQAVAAHFYNTGSGEDSVYEFVNGLSA